jgi:hypothetical protein
MQTKEKVLRVKYKILYEDFSGVRSQVKETDWITVVNQVVVLYLLPTMSTYTTKIYRTIETTDITDGVQNYYFIGSIKPNKIDSTVFDSGIFVDSNLTKGANLGSVEPVRESNESRIMYGEPGYADWYKWTNTADYDAGDGEQITGITTIEGCLVVFKERQIKREVWQGQDPPMSQRSDVNRQIGCIAPNTLININDNAYFLSAEGLYVYNNNTVLPVDKVFNQELKKVMFGEDGKLLESMRDASCGYNPTYNELYLNIPPLKSYEYPNYPNLRTFNYQTETGTLEEYSHVEGDYVKSFVESFYGHVYVVSLNKGYVTKFGYQDTVKDRIGVEEETNVKLKEVIHPTQMVRLYYTNSNAELRSGDILPIKYNNELTDYTVALMYIETPYLRVEDSIYPDINTYRSTKNIIYRDTDDILDVTNAPYLRVTNFPPYKLVPVLNKWKSKFFTGGTEVFIKRLREIILNVFSKGRIKVSIISYPYEAYDASIGDWYIDTDTFNPSVDSLQPITKNTLVGTKHNVLYFVPESPNLKIDGLTRPNDYLGKPLKFSIEIESELRTQINSVVAKIRIINV